MDSAGSGNVRSSWNLHEENFFLYCKFGHILTQKLNLNWQEFTEFYFKEIQDR